MIPTCGAIRPEIEAGRVVIEPYIADQVGPASIDLHLGDEIRVMHAWREPVARIIWAVWHHDADFRRAPCGVAAA
jgi:deoxycytidine triphosphate deaminase